MDQKNSIIMKSLNFLDVMSASYVRQVVVVYPLTDTAQKMKFSIEDFYSKCDQIRWKLWIWSHLLKKSLMENFTFDAVCVNIHQK